MKLFKNPSVSKLECCRCGKQARPADFNPDQDAGWIFDLGSCNCETAELSEETLTRESVSNSPESIDAQSQVVTALTIPDDEWINHRFRILKLLGKGGMGSVYKVLDTQTNTVLALKLLHQKISEDASALKRFEQEANAAAQLDHPNLVPIYANGVTESGNAYLVMEYIEGENLACLIESEGSLLEQRALNIFSQICEAISYAHEHKIIHRDIKPSNILLTRTSDGNETVRVVDFGIAKTISSNNRETRDLTQTGEVFGSPQYMSPLRAQAVLLSCERWKV